MKRGLSEREKANAELLEAIEERSTSIAETLENGVDGRWWVSRVDPQSEGQRHGAGA